MNTEDRAQVRKEKQESLWAEIAGLLDGHFHGERTICSEALRNKIGNLLENYFDWENLADQIEDDVASQKFASDRAEVAKWLSVCEAKRREEGYKDNESILIPPSTKQIQDDQIVNLTQGMVREFLEGMDDIKKRFKKVEQKLENLRLERDLNCPEKTDRVSQAI